jgi:hypothetical protein
VREIRTLRSTWRGLETWHGRDSVTLANERARNRENKLRPKPARQSSTLRASRKGKRVQQETNLPGQKSGAP